MILWTEHQKSAHRNPDLDQFIQNQSEQYINKDVRLGVKLLRHVIHNPDLPFSPHLFPVKPKDHAYDCGKAFAQAALLCVGHHDLPLLKKVISWASTTPLDCLLVTDPYCMKICGRLAQLNEKDLLEKVYDIVYPEKDLTKLQRFRFSLGSGVSPQTMDVIMRSAVEALAWDVLEWITPLALNYQIVAPSVGSSPYKIINSEMLGNYASEPQYDEVFVWWLNQAQQDDIELDLLCCGAQDNQRRIALALQYLDAEHLDTFYQKVLSGPSSRDFFVPVVENETARRQNIAIAAHLGEFGGSSLKRKI